PRASSTPSSGTPSTARTHIHRPPAPTPTPASDPMASDYHRIIVGMGSAGLVAAEFAATLDLRIAAVERDRLGGDCLWTGCVPSKALLASAKVAHHMRTADHYGITAVEPQVNGGRVWDRIRTIQQEIAGTDDNPGRYEEMGV